VTCRPAAGQDSVNTFPRQRIRSNNRITSVAMQPAVNTTVEEEVIYTWFAYIHYWARDVFCGSASRLHKESSLKTEVSRRTRMRLEQVLGSQGTRVG
jgi:hypothetical protein